MFVFGASGERKCLSRGVVYLGAESVAHGYGTGDANWEIPGPENTFEMLFHGVKELIRSFLAEPGHTSSSFPCDGGSGVVSGVRS